MRCVSDWFLSFARRIAVALTVGRARGRGRGSARRDGSFRGGQGVATRAPGKEPAVARGRARDPARDALRQKQGFATRWTDGTRRTRARAVAARSARDGIDVADTLVALMSIPRASRGSETGPVARHGAGRDVPSARGPANPKYALAMRPGPARRLERATRGRRGDGDFGNWRRARTILCNPDYYVTRCTCAADRGTPGGATGVFRHPRVRKNANDTLMADAREAHLAPDFVSSFS